MGWLPKKCIVVPFDFSEQADQALESAQVFASDLAGLHVVHVLPTIELAEPGVIWETIDDDARRHHVEAAFGERFANTPVREGRFPRPLRRSRPRIAAYAEELHADLIVMPSHGRTGLSRLFIGSVASAWCDSPLPGAHSEVTQPRVSRPAVTFPLTKITLERATVLRDEVVDNGTGKMQEDDDQDPDDLVRFHAITCFCEVDDHPDPEAGGQEEEGHADESAAAHEKKN